MHNLMGHMHLHSDSKPFKCLYCPSKFTLKGNLTRHMKVKHGVMDRGLDERCKDAHIANGKCIVLLKKLLDVISYFSNFSVSSKRAILFVHSHGPPYPLQPRGAI